MDTGNPIRNDKGEVPFISIGQPEWESWYGLGVDAERAPDEAAFYMNFGIEHRDLNMEPITESGKLQTMEWGVQPGWHRILIIWRSFIPVKDYEGEFPTPPFLDFDEPAPTVQSIRGRWFIPTALALSLASRFEELDEIVASCAQANLGNNISLDHPPAIDVHNLSTVTFDSEPELQKAVTVIKRGIADRMGWLTWFRAFVPQNLLRERVQPGMLASLLEETWIEYRKRGCLLHLANCWQDVNIPLLLAHNVPIIYCWCFDERVLPQLARMNPRLLAGDTSDDQVCLYDMQGDEEFEAAVQASWNFDEYFQPKVPNVMFEDLAFELDAKFFIIDFQGWGRRALPDDIDSAAYSERFCFRTINTDGVDGRPIVIFWHWRKKTTTTLLRSNWNSRNAGEMDESFIREAYRNKFAPMKGRLFDEELGTVLPNSPTANGPITLFSDHRRDGERDDSSISGTESQRSQSSEPAEEGSQSLFERLGMLRPDTPENTRPFTTVATITSWRAVEREERGRGDRQSRRRSRSPSPRRPVEREVAPYLRPLVLFRRRLKEVGHIITHEDYQQRLPFDLEWNPSLLAYGVLIVTEQRSEVRLRYFANASLPGVYHVGSLLKLALEKRLAFTIAIKESNKALFAPRRISRADRINGNYIYGRNFIETYLEPNTPTIFAANYIARISELLKRPHAAAFVGLGGACSWIAQRWGGDEMIACFMKGPSIQTTIFGRGASDVQSENPKGLLWDEISGSDIDLLFGLIPDPVPKSSVNNKWIYPPPQVIDEVCDNWTGEWNSTMEAIFVFITKEIVNVPCKWTPKSAGGWKRWLRTYNGGIYTPVNVLTEDHITDIMKGFSLAGLPPSWNLRPLSNVYIPEVAE